MVRPTTIPAAAHAAATCTVPEPAASITLRTARHSNRDAFRINVAAAAEVTPQNAARMGDRPNANNTTMTTRGTSRCTRDAIAPLGTSLARGNRSRSARK